MNKTSKTKLAIVNFFPIPSVKKAKYKITKYYQSFDYLYELTNHYDIQVFDRIGKTVCFNYKKVTFNYFRAFFKSKLIIPIKQFLAIKRFKPDIVFIDGLGYPHFIVLLKIMLDASTRFIVRDHADRLPRKTLEPLYKLADRYVESYLFTAKEMGKEWVDRNIIKSEDKILECVEGSTKFSYLENGIKLPSHFLWVGRLDKNKDPLTILEAFSEYVKTDKKAILKMIFDSDILFETVKSTIKKNKLESNVILIGKVPHADIEHYFRESTFFILGSYKEGGPFSLIEAMACGCIPIVTNIPAFKKMLDNGRFGFMYSPGNSEELKQILFHLKKQDLDFQRKEVLHWFDKELSNKAIAEKIKQLD
ncbi:glycosyltransferase family 4 protein [Lacinutrix himadriensis]|uniref:glycosyltransferase family 4 protein n=1 Tax=Lacinutrix himadriensis TaxID=641549 RepID=UPI000A846CFE|nr:glycosyltransferase family 4 protein [Lacinutrix himadriensis]